jgi:hypothetical protein
LASSNFTNGIKGMLVKGVAATGAGMIAEFIVDFFRLPLLSESGMFGPSSKSNYEIIIYALSAGGTAAGIMDYFSNSKPLGFSKEFMPYFLGFGFGTGLYESIVAPHIRDINPYTIVYDAVPNIPLL